MCNYVRYFLGAILLTSISVMQAQVPLIPRTVLFGNADKRFVRISPDGNYIAFIAPHNNVPNVWIKKPQDNSHAELITNDTNRGISSYAWTADSKSLLYVQDTDGDENWRLYTISIETKQIRCYTPFNNVQARIIDSHKDFPDTLIISLNKENPVLHDLYKLTLSTGALELLEKNPGNVLGYLCDKELKVRGAVANLPDGDKQVLLKDSITGEFKERLRWDAEDSVFSGPSHFSPDGKSLYFFDATDFNTSRLAKLDIETNKVSYILQNPNYEIGSILLHPDTYDILAVSWAKDRPELIFFDKEIEAIYKTLKTINAGDILYLGSDEAIKKSIIAFENDNQPIDYYLYDHETKKATFLYTMREALKNYQLASMQPVTFASRDGLTIHGYLTLPVNSKTPVPLVVNVHGGPWVRDTWGYCPVAQWLANRGYAVLQVNYRGSTGYGKAFVQAANKEWGRKMQDDLIDGVHWAVKNGFADPKKVAIYGGSYGGYAALVGATCNQDTFCCAVDIVGPSNLLTWLETVPPYWQLYKEHSYRAIGNPETERDMLIARSPFFKAGQIKIPLLIAQGANDPRVKQAESEQIVRILQEHKIPHEYMLFLDEGHGFIKPENRLTFYAAAEKFLATHLGGRYEN